MFFLCNWRSCGLCCFPEQKTKHLADMRISCFKNFVCIFYFLYNKRNVFRAGYHLQIDSPKLYINTKMGHIVNLFTACLRLISNAESTFQMLQYYNQAGISFQFTDLQAAFWLANRSVEN